MPVFDKQAIQEGAARPFFASVGATDLAVEAVREALTDIQAKTAAFGKDAQKNLTNPLARDIKADAKAFGDQARKVVSEFDAKAIFAAAESAVTEVVENVSAEAKNAPERVQKFVESNVANAAGTYSDLVVRGEGLVKRIRNQSSTKDAAKAAKTTAAKAKATKTSAAKTVKSAAADAEKTAKKPAAKKAAPKKPSAATKKAAASTRSNAKATVTAAKNAASAGVEAVVDAAAKIGD